MISLAQLISEFGELQARSDLVEVELAQVGRAIEEADSPSAAFNQAQRLLRERILALEETTDALTQLTKSITRLRRIYRFTTVGWPHERDRILELIDEDPSRAAREWSTYLFQGAGGARVKALRRLIEEAPLPDGYSMLMERAATCITGIERRSVALTLPLLTSVLDHPSAVGLGPDDIRRLRLLLARLCLGEDALDSLEDLLRDESSAAAQALRASAALRRGDSHVARRELARARELNRLDLDVVHADIRQALADDDHERPQEIADLAIEALPSLVDVEQQLDRLLTPPAELWLAVAARAGLERRDDLRAEAAGAAEVDALTRSGTDAHRILAQVDRVRADLAEGLDRSRLLRSAGNNWLAIPDVAAAREDYERALETVTREDDPELWASLVFRKADTVAVLSARERLRRVRDDVARMLDELLEALAVPGATDAEPWSYGVEFDLHAILGEALDTQRRDHHWRGFFAATRTVSRQPENARAWLSFVDAVGAMACTDLVNLAARFAVDERGADAATKVLWLTNTGRYGEALQALSDSDEWGTAVRGWILLAQGYPRESLRLLSSVAIDPSWHWAREAHVVSRLLADGVDSARSLARRYLAELAGEVASTDVALRKSRLHAVLGDLDAAVDLVSRAQQVEIETDRCAASYLLGQLLLLRGDRGSGVELMERAVRARGPARTDEWAGVDRPVLAALAEAEGLSLDGIEVIDDLVASISRVPEKIQDPADELRERAESAAAHGVDTGDALALGLILTAIARHDTAEAGRLVERLPSHLDAERRALGTHLAGPRTGEPSADDPASVEEVATQPVTLQLGLPPSWFEEVDDPVAEHRIFQRYLPELRARQPDEVPPVRVFADAELEPDRYTVSRDEQLLRQGRAQPGHRYCDGDTFRVLPEHLRRAAVEVRGSLRIPEEAFNEHDWLARTLTTDAEETVIREVGRAAHDLSAAADVSVMGPPQQRSHLDLDAPAMSTSSGSETT